MSKLVLDYAKQFRWGFELETGTFQHHTWKGFKIACDKYNFETRLKLILARFQTHPEETVDERIAAVNYQPIEPDEFFVLNTVNWDDRLVAKGDSSVRGPEIITPNGGCTPTEFLELLKIVFDNVLGVNTECSFHIHVSGPIFPKYNKEMQKRLVQLVYHREWPSCIRERFEDQANMNKYFPIKYDEDKYRFVAWRKEYNTYEFRCLGNVGNLKDATECFEILMGIIYDIGQQQLIRRAA